MNNEDTCIEQQIHTFVPNYNELHPNKICGGAIKLKVASLTTYRVGMLHSKMKIIRKRKMRKVKMKISILIIIIYINNELQKYIKHMANHINYRIFYKKGTNIKVMEYG